MEEPAFFSREVNIPGTDPAYPYRLRNSPDEGG